MMKQVGIIANYRKKNPILLARELVRLFAKKGIDVYAPEEEGRFLGLDSRSVEPGWCNKVECVIALGGDGTFLRAARYMAPYGVPILGVNLGTLGFLTEIEVGEVEEAMLRLIAGKYRLESRMMLEAQVIRAGKTIDTFVGLNDVVVNKGPLARLITLEAYLEKEYVTTYKADGLILASPTGSTAYSLSAGGPIVYPEVEVVILTPICPHTLEARPMVIPSHKTVRVVIVNQHDSMLTIDGQHGFELHNGDQIIVRKANYYAKLIRIKEQSFFNILRVKLNDEEAGNYE